MQKETAAGDGISPEWFFPSTGGGEEQGFSDSQLEYFQGDHEKYIAREAIQNSVDARLDNKKPVVVVFERFTIPTNQLSGRDELLDRILRCRERSKGQDRAEAFFTKAIETLKAKKLSVLKISDFNTKGLSGADDDTNGNWYRLVKATGVSSAKGATGGSFGIGKGAPIAASSLRTAFYVSVNDQGQLVCQGKARLVSHCDDEGDIRQGVGFFGLERHAIRDEALIPEFLTRTERGTDIFVMGYESDEEWEGKLIRSVLHNFWLSIFHGNLEVVVRDGAEVVINEANIGYCLDKYDALDARYYYEAVTNPTQTFSKELKHLGEVSLYVRKEDGFPGQVMMVRKPKMLVFERGYRVLREPYSGVFICENDKGNAMLRDLEPPAHDKWDRNRAKNGTAAMSELEAFVKDSLRLMSESITSEPEDIPGLDRYLPDTEERDYMPSDSSNAIEETGQASDIESGREVGADKKSAEIIPDVIVRKSQVTNKQIDKILQEKPQESGGGKPGKGTGTKTGDSEGMRINTSLIRFRGFAQKTKNGIEYRLAISAKENCEGAIRLVAVGDDGGYPVDIASAVDFATGKEYKIGEAFIKDLVIKVGETARIAVRLPSNRRYTLGIESYEN
ncbi:hypothetical protein HGA34_05815 [Candidatus Falkowbacteria bacterium]|nr:hypothetical protein [Candidatus Falkowbacteria bacterium]